jgi:hypothetical protein
MKRSLRRRLSFGSNATLMTLFVVAILVVLQGVADRHRARWDLSADASSALQPETLNKLRLLDQAGEKVRITGFTAQSGKKDSYFKNRVLEDFLDELDYHSQVVEVRFVDFDKERLTAEALGVSEYGAVVVQRGDERADIKARNVFKNRGNKAEKSVEFVGEAAMNEAFSEILSKQQRKIYVLAGHGELNMESTEPEGLSELAKEVEQEHYKLQTLDLLRQREEGAAPRVPEDAAALVIARPQTTLAAPEEDALASYIGDGGRVLLAMDVGLPPPHLLASLGVAVLPGVVMDKLRVFPYDDRPIPVARPHPITDDLVDSHVVTVLSHVAPLSVSDPAPGGAKISPLLVTSRDGWIDRGGRIEKGSAVYEPEIDGAGPVDMAVAVEIQPGLGLVHKGRTLGRAVVVGDADFMTNAFLSEGPGNSTFTVNALRWLVGDDVRLSAVGKPTVVRKLALTDRDTGMIRWMALGLMPLCVLMIGAAVWALRRGR